MKYIFTLFILVGLISCKKSNKAEPPAVVVPAPTKATLVFPESNATCKQGTIVSATESTITLKWNSATNTNSYEVFIKNLLTGTSVSKTSTATELAHNFLQNTPYSWYVVSKSTTTTATAQSETWKFYNSGTATSSFAPYPAELLIPTKAQSVNAVAGKTTLDWNGADADNDIIGYDIYLGTTVSNMAIIRSNVTETVLNDVSVNAATTYFWKVDTKDTKGNSSFSEVYNFKVN